MQQSLKTKDLKVVGYSLTNIRLVWNCLAFIHLVVTAVVTLSIDVTVDHDPLVRAYNRVRWKLITCLFNMISLGYLPLCIYCDWCEKQGEESPLVQRLRVLRDVVMTSILLPITAFSDITFWMLFIFHPSFIAPPRVFDYVPYWAQHSLHSISMVTAVVDLLLTPRRRPDSMKPRLLLMMALASAYCLMVYMSLLKGEFVYLFMSTASNKFMVAVYLSFHAALITSFYAQWHLIDYVWGPKGVMNKSLKRNKS